VPPSASPAPAQAKLDQIKDLYVTAEAIGEDALVKHFEQVSRRQRELIREYFEQSGFRANAAARELGTPSLPDEAQLPG
jgi:ABC-type transporter MlaC component